MFETHRASSRYRLRLHRARSVVLSPQELVEIRAAQRTFEGAYIRTSLSQFSFALIVLKIFTSEFYSIGNHIIVSSANATADFVYPGALFAVYGAGVLGVSAFRRMQGNRQFFSEVGEDGLSRKRYVNIMQPLIAPHRLSASSSGGSFSSISATIQLSFRITLDPALGAQV
jgi:uncharacterized membrane protein YidH (DUF202 family)